MSTTALSSNDASNSNSSSSPISTISVPANMMVEQDKRIQKLQEQLRESNRVQIAQAGGRVQQGKNVMRKMKKMTLKMSAIISRLVMSYTIQLGQGTRCSQRSWTHFEIIHKACARS
jgi:hypothetical protein